MAPGGQSLAYTYDGSLPLSTPDGHPKSPTCGHFKIPHLTAQISR